MIDARAFGLAGLANGRQPALGANGMVSSPNPFATLVGLDVLRRGGNAVDAALAVSAALMVATPHQCGPGGDAWWLITRPGQEPEVLNASGESGSDADPESLLRAGHRQVPVQGASAVTVPGATAGWAEVHDRYATRDLPSLFAPAITAAVEGLAVSPYLERRLLIADALLESRPTAAAIFRPHGRPMRAGERLTLPDLANTLEQIARDPRALYKGELADRIVQTVRDEGGWLTRDDLAEAKAIWDAPVRGDFAGLTVWEAPPNSQGIAALIALGIASRLGVTGIGASGDDPIRQHTWIEAARIALAVRDFLVGDPREMAVQPAALLDPMVLDALRVLVTEHAMPEDRLRRDVARTLAAHLPASFDDSVLDPDRLQPSPSGAGGDTVHFAVVDRDRLAVSCIQSLFINFGTGIAVPGTGVLLHNRGSSFSLESGHPNLLRPRRRPLHTLTPGLATESGQVTAVFGSMGGHAQIQLHLQMLDGIVVDRLDPATVTDRPRWFARTDDDGQEELLIEGRGSAGDALGKMGHKVLPVGAYDESMGHEQIIVIDHERGVLIGAADPRSDGLALGY